MKDHNLQNSTKFFLKSLVPSAKWTFKSEPSKEVIIFYVNDRPIIGIKGSTYEVYNEIDYLTFEELKKHFPNHADFYYQAIRFIGHPHFDFEEVEGIYLTIEKTVDQTILHLASEFYHRDKLDAFLSEIKKTHVNHLIGSLYRTVEARLYEILYQKKLTISFGESVTGGMLTSRLINVKGASEVIGRSFITYSNDAKADILGVNSKIINKYGLVSPEVAEAMVKGLAKVSKADVNVSVTGYAGGEKANPDDGLCYFGFLYKDYLNIERLFFKGERNEVRTQITSYILWRVGQLLTLKP